MKRLALTFAALGVVGSSAFAVGAAQAYQPTEVESLEAVPDSVEPGGTFEAVVSGCFPGEPGDTGEEILFLNLGISPTPVAVATCELPAYEARVTFQAPLVVGTYRIVAFLPAEDPDDLSGRPTRFLEAFYDVVPPGSLSGDGGAGGGAIAISTGGSGDAWPSFMSSAGFYRVFLALLALLAGIFFVVLWRRRREDERLEGTFAPAAMPPPDPSKPSLA